MSLGTLPPYLSNKTATISFNLLALFLYRPIGLMIVSISSNLTSFSFSKVSYFENKKSVTPFTATSVVCAESITAISNS